MAPADLPRLNEVSLSPSILFSRSSSLFSLACSSGSRRHYKRLERTKPPRFAKAAGARAPANISCDFPASWSASEIALSLVLLIGAGLLFRSFWQLLEVRPGFDPHHVTTAKIWLALPNDPKNNPYLTIEKRAAFHQEILRRIAALPGVEQAAIGSPSSAPMDSKPTQSPFRIEGRASDLERIPVAEVASVTPGYFSVLKTPLIAGRFFTDEDNAKGQQVVSY